MSDKFEAEYVMLLESLLEIKEFAERAFKLEAENAMLRVAILSAPKFFLGDDVCHCERECAGFVDRLTFCCLGCRWKDEHAALLAEQELCDE